MHYLYQIKHLTTGNVYIGITNNPQRRWNAHQSAAVKGTRGRLYSAMRKYGLHAFQFTILFMFASRVDCENAEITEIARRKASGCVLYNVTPGGRGVKSTKSDYTKWKQAQRRTAMLNALDEEKQAIKAVRAAFAKQRKLLR